MAGRAGIRLSQKTGVLLDVSTTSAIRPSFLCHDLRFCSDVNKKEAQTLIKSLSLLCAAALLSACGTTYVLPEIDATASTRAQTMFVEAKADTSRVPSSEALAEKRFQRVSARVQPVAQRFCELETQKYEGFDCSVRVEIDRKLKERNAYFTYINDKPVIRLTMPILQDVESDDEVAFIMSHEYGHLIGRHIEKQQQQAVAGALILGVLTAYSNAQAASVGAYYDPNAVGRNMELGAAVGSRAYSQSYELESDTLGTRIAKAAGYDPVKGARFFARGEETKTEAGRLSFWGTHPPDEKRLATVIATNAQIEARQALQRKQ